jgi:hypothetical protein
MDDFTERLREIHDDDISLFTIMQILSGLIRPCGLERTMIYRSQGQHPTNAVFNI